MSTDYYMICGKCRVRCPVGSVDDKGTVHIPTRYMHADLQKFLMEHRHCAMDDAGDGTSYVHMDIYDERIANYTTPYGVLQTPKSVAAVGQSIRR